MERNTARILGTSIARKQTVALTGLILVTFVVLHLAGNLLLFAGPDTFNSYAEHLRGLGPLLWMMRVVLLIGVLIHITLTILLTLENLRSRGTPYEVKNDFGETSFAKKTMIYTGLLVFFFLFLHLSDYSFAVKTGPATAVATAVGAPEELGLFGLVWNSFLRPWRSVVYVLAVSCVGLHVSHGIESLCQTMGAKPEGYMPIIRRISVGIGVLVGVGFSSIPVYVWIRHLTVGFGV